MELTAIQWAKKTIDSVMTRKPEINPRNKWEYEDGLVLDGVYTYWKQNKDKKYFDYIKYNLDLFIDGEGNIPKYQLTEFNIDHVNNGKIVLDIYHETKDERYKKVAESFREQLRQHPRTTEGGFWHKYIYPSQMWLDGIYMGDVFYAKYIQQFGQSSEFDDCLKQFEICYRQTKDEKTGLLFHAWDEQKIQPWANKKTGLSENIWGRSIGWYMMALVDVLDYFPEKYEGNHTIQKMLDELVEALFTYRDERTGLWYQVVDKMSGNGNYLESSASCMIVYALAKACRQGLIRSEYKEEILKSYASIIEEFITVTKEGLVNVNKICYVAGLGGADMRDGTYAYYMSEPIVANDHKGVGAFILASLEVGKLQD